MSRQPPAPPAGGLSTSDTASGHPAMLLPATILPGKACDPQRPPAVMMYVLQCWHQGIPDHQENPTVSEATGGAEAGTSEDNADGTHDFYLRKERPEGETRQETKDKRVERSRLLEQDLQSPRTTPITFIDFVLNLNDVGSIANKITTPNPSEMKTRGMLMEDAVRVYNDGVCTLKRANFVHFSDAYSALQVVIARSFPSLSSRYTMKVNEDRCICCRYSKKVGHTQKRGKKGQDFERAVEAVDEPRVEPNDLTKSAQASNDGNFSEKCEHSNCIDIKNDCSNNNNNLNNCNNNNNNNNKCNDNSNINKCNDNNNNCNDNNCDDNIKSVIKVIEDYGFDAYVVNLKTECKWKAVLAKHENEELGYYFRAIYPLESHCKDCFAGPFRVSDKLVKIAASIPSLAERKAFNEKIYEKLGYCIKEGTIYSHKSRKRGLAKKGKEEENHPSKKKMKRDDDDDDDE